jgi:hypothetical protein
MDSYEYADLIDDPDKVAMLVDPTSSYANASAYAIGRAIDDSIIAAALGTAYTGKTGSTSTSNSNSVSVGSPAAGLTIAKLVEARKVFDNGAVDPSIPKFIAVGPEQIEDLLNNTTVTSADYNSVN